MGRVLTLFILIFLVFPPYTKKIKCENEDNCCNHTDYTMLLF